MKDKKFIYPLVITRSLVVFPKASTRIDVVRESTIAAVQAASKTEDYILVVSQVNAEIENPTFDDIYKVGTLCKIEKYSQLKKVMRITINPLFRVKLDSMYFDETKKANYATATELLDVAGDHDEERTLAQDIFKELENLTEFIATAPKELVNMFSHGVNALEMANLIANELHFLTTAEKQTILETSNVNDRLRLVLGHISRLANNNIIEKEINDKVRQSTEKGQKEYILREKLKAIRSELGEDDGDNSESTILERLEKEPFPQNVKDKIKSELKRFNMMPPSSLEASLIKGYIDLMMALPWYQKTQDNDDLKNVQKTLDEDHYGLEKVKERIVEYLAVKKMTNSLKAPILCFYGPPGVGKTSLGKSIARALGRKFYKVALGGISDEAEIRGHRRTYVGSMPGRIIAGMKKCGVVNPVFLLDEVDKIGSSQKGDPSSALLEVLDPEQNFAFNDNFLEEPYDLSNVLFIATANYLENIPGPLRDRLELIEVNSYTILEKIQIAKDHLVKKQIAANGLKNNQISFTKNAISYIIEHYTRESGVRELERKIAAICRKVVVTLLTDPEVKKVKIDENKVKELLGNEIFDDTKKDKEDQVGVVTGLAYTQYGGCILPIEVNTFPGKGRLVLTGKLGDVMKESASIALDYVRANADKYHIDSQIFENNDTHIHVPEGAVPKDGPSAGIAITTAIISCFSKTPVKSTVAMTGEVTLRGNALPIGGLREKSLAALRSGIKTIIVPRENKNTVNELPEEVKKTLEIVFMDNVDDALKVALRG